MKPVRAEDLLKLDKNLEVVPLQKYPIPEQVVYQAAKCDYSETPIHHQEIPPPSKCGEWIVNSLLGNERGHYGCYSSDTQVLTDNGWVYWPEVKEDTVLAAYNTKSHTIQYEIPSAIQNWDYEGKMYSLQITYAEDSIDLLVSPDHRIIFSDTKDGLDNYKILTAEEFYNLNKDTPGVYIPDSSGGAYNIIDPKEEWVNYKGTIHCASVSTGALIVRRNESSGIVCGNCLEHPQITFSTAGYVHNVMVQGRTHRIGTSWDCLAAESLISVKSGRKIKQKFIRELYEMYERKEELPLVRSLNEDRGYFEYSKIGKIFKNGSKDLYLVTLNDGKKLRCSMDHRIFTESGWKRLKELNVGDKVACNGVVLTVIGDARQKYTNPIWLSSELKIKTPKKIAEELGVSYEVIKKYAYKFGLTWEIKKDYSRKYPDDTEARVYNWQRYNKENILDHHGGVCSNCVSATKLHCHHKTPIKEYIGQAYNIDNYEVLFSSCHGKEHKSLRTHFVAISSIEFLRTDTTYDIEVDGKYHNFVCDGIVVHNCQSQRYTGKRVVKVANGELNPEDVFYVRPPGFYTNRKGKKYDWTEDDYQDELKFILEGCKRYALKYEKGICEEHIRDYLSQAIRQNFVVSFNLRSVLHFMDLRAKMDAQLEIQALCSQIAPHLQDWAPHVWEYYKEKRLYRARLSP